MLPAVVSLTRLVRLTPARGMAHAMIAPEPWFAPATMHTQVNTASSVQRVTRTRMRMEHAQRHAQLPTWTAAGMATASMSREEPCVTAILDTRVLSVKTAPPDIIPVIKVNASRT